jgi:hypothetical protein
MDWSAIVQCLLERIEHEAGMGRPADPPPNNVEGVDVDHERDIDEPALGRDVGEVR